MRYLLNVTTISASLALLLLSHMFFHWISFLPDVIPINYLLYTTAISIAVGLILSFIFSPKNRNNQKFTDKFRSLVKRWFKYNFLAGLLTTIWSVCLAITLKVNFMHLLLGYGLIVFSLTNTIFLITSCFITENIHEADIFLINTVSAASLIMCNVYFPNYFQAPASHCIYIIFGAIITTIISILTAKVFNLTKGSNFNSNNLFTKHNAIFTFCSLVFFSILGIAIFYSKTNTSELDILIPLSIIAGLLIVNFIAANNFIGSERTIQTQDVPTSLKPTVQPLIAAPNESKTETHQPESRAPTPE